MFFMGDRKGLEGAGGERGRAGKLAMARLERLDLMKSVDLSKPLQQVRCSVSSALGGFPQSGVG